MIKSIHLSESQSVEVNSSAGWLFIYRETFGRDILPDILPIVETAISAIVTILDEAGDKIITENLIEALRSDSMIDAYAKFSTMEFVTILQIFWALAKNADKALPNCEDWANELEVIPMDIIVPELFDVISSSMVSSKNLKRLKSLKDNQTVKTILSGSTQSQSEQSLEA